MKKILVGICGIGNGHINRQTNVIKELLKNNYRVVIATTKEKMEFLNSEFPDLKKISITIPWITCNQEGINFEDCLNKYENNNIDQYKEFFKFAIEVEKYFDGKPDLIISDYEPNVAQYAYATKKPLICMEQQSKFIYLENREIDNYSIEEEISRLNYFFPRVDYRLISSFFKTDIKENNVCIMPPIIKEVKRNNVIKNKGLVYFSPYCNDKNKFIKILDMISKIKNVIFVVYTNLDFQEYNTNKNITFKKFGKNFDEDFSNSNFIISSSGHQLISESISGNIPMFLFTLDTYEQNYNCEMVEKYNLGKRIEDATVEEFNKFYSNINFYIQNINNYKNKNWNKKWNDYLIEILQKFR